MPQRKRGNYRAPSTEKRKGRKKRRSEGCVNIMDWAKIGK